MKKVVLSLLVLLSLCGCSVVDSHISTTKPLIDTAREDNEISYIDKLIQEHVCKYTFEELYSAKECFEGTLIDIDNRIEEFNGISDYLNNDIYTVKSSDNEIRTFLVPRGPGTSINGQKLYGFAPYINCIIRIYYISEYKPDDVNSAKVIGFSYDVNNEESLEHSVKVSKKILDTYNAMEKHSVCCPEMAMMMVIKELGLENVEKHIFDTDAVCYLTTDGGIISFNRLNTNIDEIDYVVRYDDEQCFKEFYINLETGEITLFSEYTYTNS